MSKKSKASTMTLKDFHGGSIPSDLQLPSAPGMTVDRGAYDRQPANVWSSNRGFDRVNGGGGGGGGGSYHRLNGMMRGGFEDKASYFPNTANIGRSYDEDERRPADHRPRSSPASDFPKYSSDLRAPAPDLGYRAADHYSPYLGRYGVPQASVVPPRTPPERPSNAWAARRGAEADPPAGSPWRVRNSMARIAEASAIDKVSSGRWQPGFNLERSRSSDSDKLLGYEESRKIETLQISHEPEFETHGVWNAQVGGQPECYRVDYGGVRGYNEGGRVPMPVPHGSTEHGEPLRRGNEQRYTEPEYRNSGREEDRYRGYDRLEVHDDGGRYYGEPHGYQQHADVKGAPVNRPVHGYERSSTSEAAYHERPVQRKGSSEWDRTEFDHGHVVDSDKGVLQRSTSGDRPKLKLMPKSKLVDEEADELHLPEEAQLHDTSTYVDAEHERPKLALKPRSQAADPVTGCEKERQNLFGGARPRELVLKERGADDVMISGEATPTSCDQRDRDAPRNGERQESGRVVSRREHEPVRSSESERYDSRRDFGRQDRRDHHQQQQQLQHQHQHQHQLQLQQQEVKRDIDRQDSWRRPADPSPHSPLAEIPSRSLGAAAVAGSGSGSSALQLAQAFSRPATLSRSSTGSRLTDNRYNNNTSNNNNSNNIFSNSSSFKQPASSRAAW